MNVKFFDNCEHITTTVSMLKYWFCVDNGSKLDPREIFSSESVIFQIMEQKSKYGFREAQENRKRNKM